MIYPAFDPLYTNRKSAACGERRTRKRDASASNSWTAEQPGKNRNEAVGSSLEAEDCALKRLLSRDPRLYNELMYQKEKTIQLKLHHPYRRFSAELAL